MWGGGAFRHYANSLYVIAGLFGAVATLVLGVIFCWCADVIEEEYLDEPEKVITTKVSRDENGAIEKVVTTETKKKPEKEEVKKEEVKKE
jgi:Na+-translocating ferredoxin:NAD+ oxidoreductase RnfG subunit